MDLKRKQQEEALIISDGGTPVACGAHPPPLKEHQVFWKPPFLGKEKKKRKRKRELFFVSYILL